MNLPPIFFCFNVGDGKFIKYIVISSELLFITKTPFESKHTQIMFFELFSLRKSFWMINILIYTLFFSVATLLNSFLLSTRLNIIDPADKYSFI